MIRSNRSVALLHRWQFRLPCIYLESTGYADLAYAGNLHSTSPQLAFMRAEHAPHFMDMIMHHIGGLSITKTGNKILFLLKFVRSFCRTPPVQQGHFVEPTTPKRPTDYLTFPVIKKLWLTTCNLLSRHRTHTCSGTPNRYRGTRKDIIPVMDKTALLMSHHAFIEFAQVQVCFALLQSYKMSSLWIPSTMTANE